METQYKISYIENGFQSNQFVETYEDANSIYNEYLKDETKSDVTMEETTDFPKHPTQ
jgi:hypothetical protein